MPEPAVYGSRLSQLASAKRVTEGRIKVLEMQLQNCRATLSEHNAEISRLQGEQETLRGLLELHGLQGFWDQCVAEELDLAALSLHGAEAQVFAEFKIAEPAEMEAWRNLMSDARSLGPDSKKPSTAGPNARNP